MTDFRHVRVERYRRPSRLRDALERLCLHEPHPAAVFFLIILTGLGSALWWGW